MPAARNRPAVLLRHVPRRTVGLPLDSRHLLVGDVRCLRLGGGNDSPLVRIIDDLPDEMIVFSSDFPHFEGFTEPAQHYADLLAPLDDARRARFLGGTIADVYRRMGDPLALPGA